MDNSRQESSSFMNRVGSFLYRNSFYIFLGMFLGFNLNANLYLAASVSRLTKALENKS